MSFFIILCALILTSLVVYRSQLRAFYLRWKFYQQAIRCGLNLQQRRMLWQLVEIYHPQNPKQLLMNSRMLNKTLLKAINDVELDLSIDLKERELRQYQYYELKRFFDRVEVQSSLASTRELKSGEQVVFNRPHNVRASFVGWCVEVTNQGFLIRLDKANADRWLTLKGGEEFEFIYSDDRKIEHHFTTKLRSVRQESPNALLLFQHTRHIELVIDRKPPYRRFAREAVIARAELAVDGVGNRKFLPHKESSCQLLELSLASAVVKTNEYFDVNQFVYLQFMGSTQRIVCYGRIERIVQVEQYRQVHVQFLQTSRSSLNQISSLVYDL